LFIGFIKGHLPYFIGPVGTTFGDRIGPKLTEIGPFFDFGTAGENPNLTKLGRFDTGFWCARESGEGMVEGRVWGAVHHGTL
jgi:hypothetical protein